MRSTTSGLLLLLIGVVGLGLFLTGNLERILRNLTTAEPYVPPGRTPASTPLAPAPGRPPVILPGTGNRRAA